MVLIALMRTPRFSVAIAVFVGIIYGGISMLAPLRPWQPMRPGTGSSNRAHNRHHDCDVLHPGSDE